jgi:hypothetical protein
MILVVSQTDILIYEKKPVVEWNDETTVYCEGEMEILAALEIKKMLVDRLVNLLSRYRIFQRIRSICCRRPAPGGSRSDLDGGHSGCGLRSGS